MVVRTLKRSRRRIAPFIEGQDQRTKYGDDMEIEELWQDIQTRRLDDEGDEEDRGLNELDRLRRLQVIKEMPVPFRTRRKLRDHMYEVGGEYQGKGCSAWRYKQKLAFTKWKNRRVQEWNNFQYAIELWGTTCTKVEGYAGSGVVSYFRMLRWIFQMDFFLFILVLGFIVVPQILFPSRDYKSMGYNANDVANLSQDSNISDIVDTCSSFYQNDIQTTTSVFDNILNFLYGSGWMENTQMFYGNYDAHEQRNGTFSYDTSAAYIATNFAVYFVSLLVLVRVAGGGYQARLEAKDTTLKNYAAKMYAYWDYGLTSEKNAKNKHKSIWRELKLDLAEERRKRMRDERSGCDMCLLVTKRAIINFLILASLGGAGYLIYYVSIEQTQLIADPRYPGWNSIVQFLVQFMTSLAISVLNAILPMIYKLLVRWEGYSPAFEVNMTLFRTIFLKLASLTILVITIYTTITCNPQDMCGTGVGTCAPVKCWETYIGQEIYKLIIMDFLIAVVMTFLVETPRALIGRCCKAKFCKMIGSPTFDLPKNVLDLIYGQTLFWLGVFFSPMIPAIVVIKLILVFYLKYFSTMINYQPNETPFRASDTQSFYVYILFFDFIICLIPTFYVIWQIPPSRGCGPFRDLNFMYLTIDDGVAAGPNWLGELLSFVISPLVLITVIFILFLALWYSMSKIGAYEKLTKIYRDELAQEGLSMQALIKVIKTQKKDDPGDPEAPELPDRKQNNKSPNKQVEEDVIVYPYSNTNHNNRQAGTTDNNSTDHNTTDHNTTDHNFTDHKSDDGLVAYPAYSNNSRGTPRSHSQDNVALIQNTDETEMTVYSQIDQGNGNQTGYENPALTKEPYSEYEEPPMDYDEDDDDL